MTATPIEQLKREALSGLDRLGVTLDNMPPLVPKLKIGKPVRRERWKQMPSFTPGPWHCKFDAFDEVLYVTSNERLNEEREEICHVSVGYDEPFESEQQANARLIAAAPELLEAVTDCVAVLTDPVVGTVKHDDPNWYMALDRAVAKARIALSKAGGQP